MERNNHPGSCQVHNSTHHPTTAWVQQPCWMLSRRATAPMTLHHGVQQPTWVLPGTQQSPLPHNCLDCSQAPNTSHHNAPRGATATPTPVRHPSAPIPTHHGVRQQSSVLSGTKRPTSRGATGALGPARSPTAPITLQLPVRHPTAPITPHHEVQQPSWILSGSQQHPSPYSTRCNNCPGSYQVHSTHHPTPRGVTTAPGSCQAHDSPPSPHTMGCNNRPGGLSRHAAAAVTPHHRVQQRPWDLVRHPTAPVTPHHGVKQPPWDPVRLPTAPTTPHDRVQPPSWIPSGTLRHPSSYTMGCNNHPGPCEVPTSPPCPTTAWVPARHRTAPTAPHHPVKQSPWDPVRHPTTPITPHTMGCNNGPGVLSGTQPPRHPTPWGATTILDPVRRIRAPINLRHGVQQPSWALRGVHQPPLPYNCPRILSGTQQPPWPHTTG
ncbi:uncharacterized protein ACIBXB_001536 [Morphnus guianensis]